jgi:hypothetical protein
MAAVEINDRIREAKVFLASRITEEAEHQGAPLSEIERKMLYSSETGWTLEDMSAVRETFARDFDRKAYEKRVTKLIRSLRARLQSRGDDEYEAWSGAIGLLKQRREEQEEDHYLLTLIAGAPPSGEIARLVVTALVVIGVMILAIFLVSKGY